MSNPRNRILASTALALVLAAPLGYLAKGHLTAMAATSAEPAVTQFAPTVATPASEPAAISNGASGAPASASEPATSVQPAAATEQQTAIEPVVAPDPLAALDPADRAVAEKIRDLLATRGDKLFTAKKEREAVEAFYQNRNLAPVWLDKGIENARAEAVIARMKNADADGLEPGDYKAPSFSGLAPDALAEAELRLTRAVLTYARHVQAGRFPYTRVSKNIELPQAAPEPADVLSSVADAANAGKALDAYSPQNQHYRQLKAALADLRGKPGASKGQIDTITANMERWRWYPRDLGNAYSLVNLPDFTLQVMHNGGQVWTTRIVIGKPSMATPLLSETMKYLTVNPTWTVPQSIVRNEYLPALAQDPTVLDRMGLRVSYSGGGVTITQPPGDGNALGRVRFSFNNRFSVFQHDTPDKGLFSRDGPRLQPRLHARAGSAEVRRGSPRHRPPERALDRGEDPEDVRRRRARPPAAARVDLGAPDLPDRLRRQRRQARNAPRHLRPRRPHHRRDQERARPPGAGARAQARGDRHRPAQADGPRRTDQRSPAADVHHAGLRQAAAAVDLPLSVSRSKPAVDPRLTPGVVVFARRVGAQTMIASDVGLLPLPTAVTNRHRSRRRTPRTSAPARVARPRAAGRGAPHPVSAA